VRYDVTPLGHAALKRANDLRDEHPVIEGLVSLIAAPSRHGKWSLSEGSS
jgi:hypothetical protein